MSPGTGDPGDDAGGNARGKRFVTTIVEVEGREERRVVELPEFEPTPWAEGESLTLVGKSVPRVDALEKVTGRAAYTFDVARPGMLYAVLVRATIPAGRVTDLDVIAARAYPGVVDVLTDAELTSPIRVNGVGLLSRDVSYAGQPVAAVCASTRSAAEGAARLVRVTYAPAPFAVTFSDAVAPDAPKVRRSGNLSKASPSITERGDVENGLREADVVVRRTYRTPAALHSALEPHGAVAEWEGDRLTIWESTQGVYRVRDEVATGLGVPRSRVRVIKDYMGGGFGAKNNAGAHTFVAALLAKRTGRPVRCVLDRHGEQVDTGHRPSCEIRVTLGAKRDGSLTAIVAESDVAMGIGGWESSPTAVFHELYACEHVKTTDMYAWTNAQAMAAFRAPGHVEGAFALERAMDTLAAELEIDPLDLRLKNYAGWDQDKDRPYSSDTLRQCFEEGARRFGWRERSRGKRRGFGLAAQTWGAGGGPPAYATVRINSDGSIDVLSGTQDLGTGSRTILAQIAAESLGAKLGDVRTILGDTERTPYAGNSWGSMTTASVGPAVRMAAVEAQRRLLEAAAELMECDVAELCARDSVITSRDGTKRMTFADVTRKLGNVMIIGEGSRGPNPRDVGLVSVGAQFAEVEVDAETGVVRVLRIVAVHDAGRIINPLLARSQLEGGILQGVGFALFEERMLDVDTGRPLNTGLHDYKVPTMSDLPEIDASCLDIADPKANHVGARGLAEPPIIPTAPAIANAVADALGVEVNELPLTPWRVLAAVQGK